MCDILLGKSYFKLIQLILLNVFNDAITSEHIYSAGNYVHRFVIIKFIHLMICQNQCSISSFFKELIFCNLIMACLMFDVHACRIMGVKYSP